MNPKVGHPLLVFTSNNAYFKNGQHRREKARSMWVRQTLCLFCTALMSSMINLNPTSACNFLFTQNLTRSIADRLINPNLVSLQLIKARDFAPIHWTPSSSQCRTYALHAKTHMTARNHRNRGWSVHANDALSRCREESFRGVAREYALGTCEPNLVVERIRGRRVARSMPPQKSQDLGTVGMPHSVVFRG